MRGLEARREARARPAVPAPTIWRMLAWVLKDEVVWTDENGGEIAYYVVEGGVLRKDAEGVSW